MPRLWLKSEFPFLNYENRKKNKEMLAERLISKLKLKWEVRKSQHGQSVDWMFFGANWTVCTWNRPVRCRVSLFCWYFSPSCKPDIIPCNRGQRLLSNFTWADCQKRCFSSEWLLSWALSSSHHKCDVSGRCLLRVHGCSCVCMDQCAFLLEDAVRKKLGERKETEGSLMASPGINSKNKSILLLPGRICKHVR